MAKYIVYTTWYHEKGLRLVEEMRDGMRKNSSNQYSIKMVDETMGSVIAQMSEL